MPKLIDKTNKKSMSINLKISPTMYSELYMKMMTSPYTSISEFVRAAIVDKLKT